MSHFRTAVIPYLNLMPIRIPMTLALVGVLLGSSPARAQGAPPAAPSAVAPGFPPTYGEPQPAPLPPAKTGKWTNVFYGFVELDVIRDSTQSFQEPMGNGAIARSETLAGSSGRTMFGARHSRLGYKLKSPEREDFKASGILEMDFVGNQPANPPAFSEAAFFGNPTFRLRHYALKIETPSVDLLFGQSWQLFGWQGGAHPNTVQIQGVPGEIYSRAAQVRVSHLFKSESVGVELAVAAARPPQRDAQMPDGQAGLRLLINNWKGFHTPGATGAAVDPFFVGVSAVARRFSLPELVAAPVARKDTTGWGVSFDTLVPVIRGTLEDRAHALTVVGSFVTGNGIADLYSGLTGGIASPAYPAPVMGAALVAPVDPGLVAFDASGALQTIKWTSYLVGVQYYLPPAGRLWVSVNYSHMSSSNIASFAPPASVFTASNWADGNLFWSLDPTIRFGAEFSITRQTRGDGAQQRNDRVQFSAYYIF
jgi:hypothetical protein